MFRDVPAVFVPLTEDLERMEAALIELGQEQDPAARADLAQEFVQSCSLYEDTKEHALYPFLDGTAETELASRLRKSTELLREAMLPVFEAMRHTVPIDVHKPDPEGFERDLRNLAAIAGEHLELERADLYPVLAELDDDAMERLTIALTDARRHAIGEPEPPAGSFGRMLARLEERFQHHPDAATQHLPGKDRLDAALDEAAIHAGKPDGAFRTPSNR